MPAGGCLPPSSACEAPPLQVVVCVSGTFELEKKFTGEPVKTLPGEGDTEAPKNAMECAAKASEGQCWSYKRGREETICQLYTNCSSTEEAEGFVSGKPLEGEDEIEEDEDDGDY